MATGDRTTAGEPLPAEKLPGLSKDDVIQLAETHLADLIESQRATQLDTERLPSRRGRYTGRGLRRDWRRLSLRWERLMRAARSPRYALGRRIAWWRLLTRARRDWTLVAALAVTLLIVLQEWTGIEIPQPVWYAIGAVFGVSAAGAVLFLWQDLVLCPFRAWRIRRHIRKHPTHVLPTAPRVREARLVPREDPVEGRLIPRHDLYDEVIPGILRRHHRDVQIIVGEPGSGKTTALVGLAGMLARVGIVPVLVPLRGQAADDIVAAALDAFKRRLDPQVRSSADLDTLWRWLRRRKRVAILTDDIDQIGPDGERGFVLRSRLEELATKDLPIVVTARPAGIPAGVAASSIDLGPLEEDAVVSYVREIAERDPGCRPDIRVDERGVRDWVQEGRLTEAPFYLELLASLYATGTPPELPAAVVLQAEQGESGCFARRPGGGWEWNPLWVRFRLLERYYDEIRSGRVRRWLGIEVHERAATLVQLEDAALGMLRAGAHEAKARAEKAAGLEEGEPKRTRLEQFVDSDDRAGMQRVRRTVSPHEVVDTGERLRILERDGQELQFRHRIMQAYLAGRCLADLRSAADADRALRKRVADMLDRRQPEKLTAHMALTFAALRDYEHQRRAALDNGVVAGSGVASAREVALDGLLEEARNALPEAPSRAMVCTPDGDGAGDLLDPSLVFRKDRTDPDDALINLTTAAEIVRATDRPSARDTVRSIAICDQVTRAGGATRWTKLGAIAALGGLTATDARWQRIWEYARDPDYKVRRAASGEIQKNAEGAYEALRDDITHLILRAAARSALGLPMLSAAPPPLVPGANPNLVLDIITWREEDDVWALMALGWVLPAIVSGLREDSSLEWSQDTLSASRGADGRHDQAASQIRYAAYVRDARRSLEWLIALAFKGGQHNFEASVAQGFKGDAMRHAEDPEGRISGPGWVASNRRLVADICLGRAEFWYSRMLLHQALALYAIAGANRQETYDLFAFYLTPGRERHEFVWRAAVLARRAVERKQLGSDLWKGLIWRDEGEVVGRRATILDDSAAQLVADVTLLTNLNERSGEDRQAQFGHMRDLPYCLAQSKNRNEILGAGCPSECGWGMCPYSQPPVDEPNAHRGVSRAFCRQQQLIANRRKPPWQPAIRKRALEEFWWDMERRART